MIMAGGKGSRLGPLTVHRSKPGVPLRGTLIASSTSFLSKLRQLRYRRIY